MLPRCLQTRKHRDEAEGFYVPSCCPSPRSPLWVKPALCMSLILHRSQSGKRGDPGGMETPQACKEKYALDWCWWHCPWLAVPRQDRLHGAFVTALSPQPSLLSSFLHPDQKVPEKPSRICFDFQKWREIFLEVPTGSESGPELINSLSKTTLGRVWSYHLIDQHPR